MYKCLFAVLWILISANSVSAKQRVLIFAAASMKNVLEVVGESFQSECDCKVVFSFAGSGILARQIEAGAPADLFISADLQWMEWLTEKQAVEVNTIGVIAKNRLIVAVGLDKQISANAPVTNLLAHGRIAMANPVSVPAGRYGKQALENLGLWQPLKSKLVFGENVRISLALAARGDVENAIVYQSDLKVEPRVKQAYLFDDNLHAPILYPAVLVRQNSMAAKFLEFLQSSAAGKIFLEFGFTAPHDP